MNGSGATEMGDEFPEFTLSEIVKMEKLFKQAGVDRSSREFCQEVAARFSGSRYRRGQSCIKWEQVQSWFQDKQGRLTAEPPTSLIVPGEFHPSLELAIVSTTPETPLKSKGFYCRNSIILVRVQSRNTKGHDVGEGVSLICWLHPPLCLITSLSPGKTKGCGSAGRYYCDFLFSDKTTTCSGEDKESLDLFERAPPITFPSKVNQFADPSPLSPVLTRGLQFLQSATLALLWLILTLDQTSGRKIGFAKVKDGLYYLEAVSTSNGLGQQLALS